MRGRPPKAPKITRVCQVCGNEWQAYEWDSNSRGVLYCSRDCFYESRTGKPKVSRVEPEQRVCLRRGCGKIFLVGGEGNRQKIAKYCSRTCAKHGYWGEAIHKPALQMTEIKAAWLAGFFDGEGCVRWSRRKVLRSVSLTLTNTNEAVMQKVMMVTGTGKITEKQPKSSKHSLCYTWQCYGDNAQSLLRQMLPELVIKREAAEVALGLSEATEPPWTQRTRSMNADA
jgi:hypothetical protein